MYLYFGMKIAIKVRKLNMKMACCKLLIWL